MLKKPSDLRGRVFGLQAIASKASWVKPLKSRPLGRYCRSKPLVFSLDRNRKQWERDNEECTIEESTISGFGSRPKSFTGITGLDEITGGGLPAWRPTLVCGSARCGKTMLAMEFLVRGAVECGEPGVFMMFEENAAELTANVRSLGFDLDKLVKQNKVALDHLHIERSEIEATGELTSRTVHPARTRH